MSGRERSSQDARSGAAPPLLVRGGTLVTLDPEATVVEADLLAEGGRIRAIGPRAEPPPGTRTLDAAGCWVLPGLIQGHVHLGQTLFRGLAERRRLLPWLRERIWPLESGHDDESAYWSTMLGAAECLLSGTTTVQDIGLGPGARGLLEGLRDSGLRALAGVCLMDSGEGLPEALRAETESALAAAESLGTEFESWSGAAGGRLGTVLNPRFILTCSDALWRGIRELSERRGWPVHTHALEQREEVEEVRRLKGGRDEVDYFDDEGILARDLRIAHGVQLDGGHLERVRGGRFSVVHCPASNLKLGSGIADLASIRGAGVPVGIGADGAPCSNDLDALFQARLAALLQHHLHGPASFSGLEALRLATSEGARAIGLGEETGSLEEGKAADLVVLSRARPECWGPRTDPHDLIAYSASRADVHHVVVAGEVLVEDGRLTRLDLEEIRRGADQALEAVLARSGIAVP